jgi:undecaprenyl-diphosphatase
LFYQPVGTHPFLIVLLLKAAEMNFFDFPIIEFLNRFSQSENFDAFMVFIVNNNFVKGIPIVSVFWFFWFHKSDKTKLNREGIIMGMASCLVSIVVARLLSATLPFRLRPILNTDLNFVKPYGSEAMNLGTWSSFPSDNAVMFFSLATGIFLISKKAGIWTYLYVLVVICFPRVYLGYHYPTDILAGAVLGIAIPLLLAIPKVSQPIVRKSFQFSLQYTGLFYVLFFLLTYEISTMFVESRLVGSYLFKLVLQVI